MIQEPQVGIEPTTARSTTADRSAESVTAYQHSIAESARAIPFRAGNRGPKPQPNRNHATALTPEEFRLGVIRAQMYAGKLHEIPTQALLAAGPLPRDRELLELLDDLRRRLAELGERWSAEDAGVLS